MIENLGVAVGLAGEKGRGVFTTRSFTEGEVVETCPAIPILKFAKHGWRARLAGDLLRYNLSFLLYEWLTDGVALALGYGSLYNHSSQPNAVYELNESAGLIVIRALQDIPEGEEVCISYGESDFAFHADGYYDHPKDKKSKKDKKRKRSK